jgi:hypothetical protein
MDFAFRTLIEAFLFLGDTFFHALTIYLCVRLALDHHDLKNEET